MKKIITILAVLLMAAPAMATVTITAAQVGDTNEVTVSYTSTLSGDKLPRAFALDITVDGDANIVEVADYFVGECTSATLKGYGIFMSTITINASGAVTSYGNPVSPQNKLPADTQPGLGTDGITVSMASLYDASIPTLAPATSGKLFSVFVDKLPCELCINPNVSRGGIVLEDGTSSQDSPGGVTTNLPVCIPLEGGEPPVCYGDMNKDGFVKTDDVITLVALLTNHTEDPRSKKISSTSPYFDRCGDMNGDTWIKTDDVISLVAMLTNHTEDPRSKKITCPHNFGPQ